MYLKDIVEHKKEEIKTIRRINRERTKNFFDPVASLQEKPFITEIKKASPSMGDINLDINIMKQARIYEDHGAGAISVLTDKKYFKGDIDFLAHVSETAQIPTLCKDFIISEIQIENAYIADADFILLIAAILSEEDLKRLSHIAYNFNLKILYEIHTLEEFEKIKNLDPELVGVNSRDLQTFAINKENAAHIISKLDGNFLKIAESGINDKHDIELFQKAGANAYLIGTSLMQAEHPAEKLKEFYSVL